MSRPNVLWIMTDQHRAMSMGAYGSTEVLTPHLDAFAERSVRFERAYCAYPQCVAARQSLITGQRSDTHGCYGINLKTIDYSQWTLQRAFTDAGYHTTLIGHPHMNETGFLDSRTYKQYCENELTQQQRDILFDPDFRKNYLRNAETAGPMQVPEELTCETYTRQEAIRFLREPHEQRKQPLLAWVTFQKPHPPFNPPQRFWNLYDSEAITLPPTDPNQPRHSFWPEWIMQPEMVRNYLHGYYACISWADWCVGEILAEAERQGRFEDTIIIYTSDHGDSAGHHGKYEKHCFFDEAIRVPLVVHTPTTQPGVVEEIVEHVDLAPTLTEMCGVDIGDHLYEGESLATLLAGRSEGWKSRAVCDYYGGEPRTFGRMLLEGDLKCCVEGNMPSPGSLFNLRDDPDELVNLWDDPAYRQVRDRMVAEIKKDWKKYIYWPPAEGGKAGA